MHRAGRRAARVCYLRAVRGRRGEPVAAAAFSAAAAAASLVVAACGGSQPAPVETSQAHPGMNIEIAEYEILASGHDRFTACPPEGALGQGWIPEAASAGNHDSALTERLVNETLQPFRSCYHRGLVHDPTQDGRVAVALHVMPDGKVGSVETYAACRLSPEVLDCMTSVAAKLHVDPAPSAETTVVLPAVFVPRSGDMSREPTESSAYTASAYVALESARDALHACEKVARRAGLPAAFGTFAIDLDDQGRVLKQNIDPWQGNRELLVCAGTALEKVAFPAPPGGRATILLRLAFNPRAGTD